MYRLPLIIILLVLSTLGINAQERPMANPADVATIDGVMKAYYEAVSGHPGKRDTARILSLYAESAKLNVSVSDGVPIHGIVEEVVETNGFQNIK